MSNIDLSGIPERNHDGIKLLASILDPCGFMLVKKPDNRFKIVPIEGRKYYHPFTKKPISVEEAYSLYD